MAQENQINIIALEFPECVRQRMGMYVGGNDVPDVILREIIDNSVDELFGSHSCTKIDVQIKPGQEGGWYVVADNGRGIPIIMDEDKGITKTELAMGSLHAGSKFNDSKEVSIGLNGVGSSCTNALSSRFIVASKVTDDNYDKSIPQVRSLWEQKGNQEELFYILYFEKGIKVAEGCDTKSQIESNYGFTFPEGMSTIVAFQPDDTLWKSTKASYNKKSLSYVGVILDKFYNKSAEIIIDGVSISTEFESFKFDFLSRINVDNEWEHKSCDFYVNFECDKDMSVSDQSGSVNSLIVDRGCHLRYVIDAWNEALRRHFGVTHSHTTAGFKINVIAMSKSVDFSSQTKENCVKLDGLRSSECIDQLTKEFIKVFKANPEYFDDHINRLTEYANSLVKLSTISKIKSMVVIDEDGSDTRLRSKLPSSVDDATSLNRKECELYICEGKSAAGTIVKVRNPSTQAVMGLRGVPLNTVGRDLDDIIENEEMCSIISSLGMGVNEFYSMKNPRYGKVIIAADADPDGLRIASLILGFFAVKMTFMIREGMVYVLDSPLYKQGGKYIFPTDDIESELDRTKAFERYKGLGEIPQEDAEEVITGPQRRLIQINLDNVELALSLLTSTSARKDLMYTKKLLTDPYNTGIL
jgi:DNA gyrase/topoisomerase IV subunit B